jgi:hypothetical protein
LPGRPALDAFQSILFMVGIGVCLWRIRHPNYTTLLIGLIGMLLPTILTEYAPHYIRAVGVPPFIGILVGLGAVTTWDWQSQMLAKRSANLRQLANWATGAVLCVGMVASAIGHIYAYFVQWGSQPGLYHAYDVGLLETSREVRERVPHAEVYLSPIEMGHPIVRFMTWDRRGAKSYDGRYSLVLPSPSSRPAAFVVVPYLDKRTLQRLPRFYPQGKIVKQGAIRSGTPFYQVFEIPPPSEPQIHPQNEGYVNWAGQLDLIGYDTDQERYQAGETMLLTLYWQSRSPTDADYTAFTHLLGEPHPETGNPVWGGDDHQPGRASYPTSAWAAGEIVLDEFVLAIPPNAPAGMYDLEVGFYRLETMQRLVVSEATVQAGADYAIIGQIEVR